MEPSVCRRRLTEAVKLTRMEVGFASAALAAQLTRNRVSQRGTQRPTIEWRQSVFCPVPASNT
jgi:hypothetical protein